MFILTKISRSSFPFCILEQLNLFCTEREKSMPLIGTASTAGKVAGILFTGIVSDKYGINHGKSENVLRKVKIGC